MFSSRAMKLAFITDLVVYGGISHSACGPSVAPDGSSRCRSPPEEYISRT